MFSNTNPPNYIPIVNDPFLYMTGLQLSNDATTPNSLLDIAAGQCRDSTDAFDMLLPSAITINTAVNGAGGLDTGTIAANKMYAVVLIADPVSGNATNAMFTLAPTAPVMPFGYSAFRLIGYVAIDASSHILKGYWTAGNSGNRYFFYDAPQATAITAGHATSYTNVDLTKFVPLVNNLPVWIATSYTPATAGNTLKMQPGNATGDAIIITGQVNSAVVTSNNLLLAQTVAISSVNSPVINYKEANASDAVAINVAGYQLAL